MGVQPLISPFEVTGTQGAVQPKDSSYTNTTQGTVWLGGTVSKIMGDYNFIGNGINHNIEAVADFSFIGNGNNNHLGDGVNQVAYSAILAGKDNTIEGTVFNSAIIAGENNTITHSNTFILGSNISSTQTGTTYVENLNVGSLGSGISVNNLGIDASGNVVVGSSGTTSTDTYVTGATLNGNTLEIERNNGLSAVTVDLSSLSASTPTIDEVIATGNQLTSTNNRLLFPNTGFIDWTYSSPNQLFYVTGDGGQIEIKLISQAGQLVLDSSKVSLFSNTNKDLELKVGSNSDEFRIYLGTAGPSIGDVLEVKSLDGNTGIMGWATPTVSDNVFVSSGNANSATQQLTFTNTTGGTFNVTNAAALFSDNDINVTGGTYNPTTGCITFSTNSGSTFDVCGFVTGLTDTYTSSGTYDNNTAEITFTRTDASTYTVDLSTLDLNDTFSTGGTVTQSPSSGSSEVTVQIVGNEGFTPYNITGLTDTFVNDFSFSSNTFTISQNDGSSFDANLDTIDLSNILSGVSFDIATSGSISATTFNGGTFVGDGSGLSGITETLEEVLTNGNTTGTNWIEVENGYGLRNYINSADTTSVSVYSSKIVLDALASGQSTIDVRDNGRTFHTSNVEINFDTNIINLTTPNTIKYSSDYSGSYTNRSLVDKEYVDKSITGFTSGSTLQQVLTVGNETSGNDIIMTEGDDVVFKYAGWNNRINTNPLTTHRNILFPDKSGTVALLSDTTGHTENFYVTGFDYNDANTFTLTRNGGLSALTTTINTMTGLTVNGTLVVDTISATTINGSVSGLTLNDLDDVTINIPTTPDNTYQGELLYFDAVNNQWVSGSEYGNLGEVTIWGKKGSAGTIDKGCPVYIVGFDDDIHEVELANATTASTMPVIGFTAEDFDNAGVYPIVTFGKISGLDTSSATTVVNPFGETWEVNDVLYMAKTDGGLTKFRPSGTNTQIQRIAKVLKVGTTDGQLFIFNTARTAGLPNLTTDYLWLGNGNDTPQEVIRTDVGITTTGFTYNDNNTFTITDDNGGSYSATINQMSGLTVTGNVGIGISNVSAKLHINNTGSSDSFLVEDSVNPDSTPFAISSGGSVSIGTTDVFSAGGTKTKLQTSLGSSGVSNDGLPISSTAIFESNTTNAIGLLSPDASLSQIYFGTPSDTFGAFLRWDYTNKDLVLSTASASGNTVFQTGTGVEAVRIDENGDTQMNGGLIVEGQTTLRGQTTIGNSFGDSLDIVSRLTSSIVPSSDNTVDLGDGTRRWRNIYGHNITGDTLTLLNTPTLNNSGTEVLVRNSSTGEVEYRDVSTIGGGGTGVNDANKIFSWFMNVT